MKESMKLRQTALKTALPALLVLCPAAVPAQTFQWLVQEGSVSASAAVSGPDGSDSGGDSAGISAPVSANIFAGAGASVPGSMSASGTSRLETTLAPQSLFVSSELDGNGSVSNPEEQTAGGSGYVNLRLVFKVDAPAILTMTGSTGGTWTGDASVDPGFWLESTTEYMTDIIGTGGYLEYQALLLPHETYTLSAYGNASAVTSFDQSFGSAQGGFTVRMNIQGTPVPEPNILGLLAALGISVWGLRIHRKRAS